MKRGISHIVCMPSLLHPLYAFPTALSAKLSHHWSAGRRAEQQFVDRLAEAFQTSLPRPPCCSHPRSQSVLLLSAAHHQIHPRAAHMSSVSLRDRHPWMIASRVRCSGRTVRSA